MSDDLIERLRTITSSGCNPYSACHEAADELSRLRAELAAERELADRLAAQLDIDRHIVAEAAMTGFNYNDGDWPDRLFANNGAITRHLTEHATRRNK